MNTLMPRGPLAPTNENFARHAIEPMTRWLIQAALNQTKVTYGMVQRRLGAEYGFSTGYRATRLGWPAGKLMEDILGVRADAPLLNVLLVRQDTDLPGAGAGPFLAHRFRQPKLQKKEAWKKPHWREYCETAAREVYAFADWGTVYSKLFGRDLVEDDADALGAEQDGLVFGRGGGEGARHKALRLWVQANPHIVFPRLDVRRAGTEVVLKSGDRVDVVYFAPDRTVAIEVKSRDSNPLDLERGLYQCLKYRTILEAQDICRNHPVAACLVTEMPLPGDLDILRKRLGVSHQIHRVRLRT
ncbi:hypothetical protein [Magnetospirillum sp. UT-4]|uniref:hypothetical protein n=1 Tax=Magnetospirillum sp. UT-4 TaxID=2681467 RepID=UPI001380BB4D|nr:hypothetical protein [Magnetospirillum sp. UT-4]CAA7625076.1 conserved hypothetical protein [Magnetospirillum sp. UT-4]